jgi:DeoR/GlpR family transcriptional regulator of sugar metabolism
LGAHGVHPDAGLTTPNTAEAETNGRLIDATRRVVVVADSSKLGVEALARIMPLSRVDVFVTDQNAPKQVLREIELSGPKVVVAEFT